MEPAGLAIGLVALAGQLSKASMKCYDLFSNMNEVAVSQDEIWHEIRTEAFRLRRWENAWNLHGHSLIATSSLSASAHPQTQHLNATDDRYRYALASLARIIAVFAKLAELQSKTTDKNGKALKPKQSVSLVPYTKSRRTLLQTTVASSSSHGSMLVAQLNNLSLLENPRILEDPDILPGLAEEITALTNATKGVQQSLSLCSRLQWEVRDKGKLKALVEQLNRLINGLFNVLPPAPIVNSELNSNANLDNQIGLSFNIGFSYNNLRKDANFVPRDGLLLLLKQELSKGLGKGMINQVVLHGIGGIGKTQLAFDYAQRHFGEYSAIFWVDAASEETVRLGFIDIMQRLISHHSKLSNNPDYALIGRWLGMDGKLDQTGAFSVQQATEAQHVIGSVKQWFATKENTKWLLIFDNLDDLESFNLRDYVPSCCHGNIIITSRRRESLVGRRGFEIQPMQFLEAEKLLLQSSHLDIVGMDAEERELERDAMKTIGEKLAYLPLALDQAGSYLYMQQYSFTDYLQDLTTNLTDSLSRGWKHGDQERSVFATLELSFKALEKNNPKGAEMLFMCGLLHHDSIPEKLLRHSPDFIEDDAGFKDAVRYLFSFSFAKRNQKDAAVSIHPLVHSWTGYKLRKLSSQSYTDKVHSCVKMLYSSLRISNVGTKWTDWGLWRYISPHFAALQTHLKLVDFETVGKDLLNDSENLNAVIHYQGERSGKVQLYQWRLDAWKSLNTRNPDQNRQGYLYAIARMGDVFFNDQNYNVATIWYNRVLAEAEGVPGSDYAIISMVLSRIAKAYTLQKKYELAWQYSHRALMFDHETTKRFASVGNSERGPANIETSDNLHEQALAWKEGVLICGNLLDLEQVETMAFLYLGQGMRDVALEWYQQALVKREKLQGPEHPDTLVTMYNIARVYREKEQYELSMQWYQRALAAKERVLGPEDPATLATVYKIACVYKQQEQYELALQWYQRALAAEERVLGLEHLATLETVFHIACVYGLQEQYKLALQWYQRAFIGFENSLGLIHIRTLAALYELVWLHYRIGNVEEAEKLKLRLKETQATQPAETQPSSPTSQKIMEILQTSQDCTQNSNTCSSSLINMLAHGV